MRNLSWTQCSHLSSKPWAKYYKNNSFCFISVLTRKLNIAEGGISKSYSLTRNFFIISSTSVINGPAIGLHVLVFIRWNVSGVKFKSILKHSFSFYCIFCAFVSFLIHAMRWWIVIFFSPFNSTVTCSLVRDSFSTYEIPMLSGLCNSSPSLSTGDWSTDCCPFWFSPNCNKFFLL